MNLIYIDICVFCLSVCLSVSVCLGGCVCGWMDEWTNERPCARIHGCIIIRTTDDAASTKHNTMFNQKATPLVQHDQSLELETYTVTHSSTHTIQYFELFYREGRTVRNKTDQFKYFN